MLERKVAVASTSGLHARPAAVLAKVASEQSASVTVEKEGGGNAVLASSVLSLMTLGLKYEDIVVLRSEGEGSEAALDALEEVLKTNFDE